MPIKGIAFIFLTTITILASHLITIQAAEKQQKKPVPQLPIEYFTKTSETRDAIISPDGKHVITIIKRKGKEVFGILNVKDKKITSLIGLSGSGNNIGSVHWANNERIVYSVYETTSYDKRRNSTGELFAVNVDGSGHKIIFGHRAGEQTTGTRLRKRKTSYASHDILDILEDDPKNILITYYPWKLSGGYWRYNPYAQPYIKKLNIYTGQLKNLSVLPISGAHAMVDNNGKVRFAIGGDEENHSVISYKKTANSKWREFSLNDFEGTRVYPLSFAEDNQSVYLSANVGSGTRALYLFNLETESIEKVFHNESIDISQYEYDFSHKRIVYVATELALPEYHYLEPKNPKSKLHKKLRKTFPNQDVVITSATKDGKQLIALIYADNNPGDFYIFDTKTFNADYLMSRNSWVYKEDLVTTESVSFTTRDGQTIYGYLTKPKNITEKLPLVVHPHGGPHGSRDEWSYQWRVQLLANRGYAVLQVNYRGSDGFGRAFEEIGYGKWGTLMQDDITDATKALIDRKIVDPKRICIYGGSYGGYAALMGVIREPDLYQCAIGSAGVYDLPLMFEEGNIANRLKYGIAYLKEAVGEDIEDMKARSPVYNVDKIKANILLIHGGKDEQVPISHAYALKDALDEINKPYEWLKLDNEGHGYNDNENRKLVFDKILTFLDKNIGQNSEAVVLVH